LMERLAEDRLLVGEPAVADDAIDLAGEVVRDFGRYLHFTVRRTLNFISSENVMVESRSSRARRKAWCNPSRTISIQNSSSSSREVWTWRRAVSASFGTRLSSRKYSANGCSSDSMILFPSTNHARIAS